MLRKHTADGWIYYKNKPFKDKSGTFKFHILVDPGQFEFANSLIKPLLKKAARALIVPSFKILAMAEVRQYIQEENERPVSTVSADQMLIYRQWLRQMHAPFVLYLKDTVTDENVAALIKLIKEIETILKENKVISSNAKYSSTADLRLSEYFIFRGAKINGNYVPAFDSSSSDLVSLAKVSEYWRKLNIGLMSSLPEMWVIEAERECAEKKNEEKQVHQSLEAACALKGIEWDDNDEEKVTPLSDQQRCELAKKYLQQNPDTVFVQCLRNVMLWRYSSFDQKDSHLVESKGIRLGKK